MGPANGWEWMVILHDAPRLESIPVFKLIDGFLARFLDGEQGMVVCGNQSVQVRYMLPKRRYAKEFGGPVCF